jgi:NCS1 family nucleobase:cation symporter-1
MPKYMNIKRGQMFAITLGVWGFVPWKVLNSAENFMAFMMSYSIVLAPIAMLMVVDYFIVKQRKYNIYEMYRPNGIYHYWKGWNWRSYVALICAFAPNLPGMINSIDTKIDIGNIRYVYIVSNLVAYVISVSIYLTLCHFFPAPDSVIEVEVHDVIPGGGKYASEKFDGEESSVDGDGVHPTASHHATVTGDHVGRIDKEENLY